MNNQQNGTHDKNEASNFGGKLVSVGIFLALVLLAVSSFFLKNFNPLPNQKPTEMSSLQPTFEITTQPAIITSVTSTPAPTPIAGDSQQSTSSNVKVNSVDGNELVYVPDGSFLMGSDASTDPYFWGAEAPKHTVTLNAFWIYRTEVTNSEYEKCVQDNSCSSPQAGTNPVAQEYGNPQYDQYPVVMVTWNDSNSYCKWAGARLPTEAEWEKAARGTDGRLFPWGNSSNADGLANYNNSSPVAVGSFPNGASPYGAYDMAGNVLEWVNDFLTPRTINILQL